MSQILVNIITFGAFMGRIKPGMMMAERISKIPLNMVILMLAAALVGALFLAGSSYLRISANEQNNHYEKARLLLAAAGDPMQGNARFDFDSGFANRTSIINWRSTTNKNLKTVSVDTLVKFYSPMSEYAQVSASPDEFQKSAYRKLSSGEVDFVASQRDGPGGKLIRYAVRQFSKGNCIDCGENELIGLKEISFSPQVSNTGNLDWLLYAGVALLGALLFLVGVVMPLGRTKERQKEQMARQMRKLELEANTDVLTGLPNRRFFEGKLDSHLKEFNEQDRNFGLFILDIDHFKQVNDKFGHDAGDIVLQKIAGRISRAARKGELVCRIGGEEFAVIAPYDRHESIASVAERYRTVVAEMYIDVGTAVLRPSVSIGVATNISRGNYSEDLLKTADEKLYLAKNNGRNRVAA